MFVIIFLSNTKYRIEISSSPKRCQDSLDNIVFENYEFQAR